MNNLLKTILIVSFSVISAASNAATVTFNYVGKQLFDIGSNAPLGVGGVTASITFNSSRFSDYGYPTLDDVVAWSVTTPIFTLTNETAEMNSQFPTPPFVIRNGGMFSWNFVVSTAAVPYQSVVFTSNPNVYTGTRWYEHVYSQDRLQNEAKSLAVGEWSQVTNVPLPSAIWLFSSTALLLQGKLRVRSSIG